MLLPAAASAAACCCYCLRSAAAVALPSAACTLGCHIRTQGPRDRKHLPMDPNLTPATPASRPMLQKGAPPSNQLWNRNCQSAHCSFSCFVFFWVFLFYAVSSSRTQRKPFHAFTAPRHAAKWSPASIGTTEQQQGPRRFTTDMLAPDWLPGTCSWCVSETAPHAHTNTSCTPQTDKCNKHTQETATLSPILTASTPQ